jgi:lipopolysaccharide/colanic/teichoic acid biosynthesis glycosyltransferase
LTLFEINLVNISGVERIVKRVIDIFVSLIALTVFSPVIIIVSLSIILDSGRPVFFLQDRVGVNGKTFKTIKFRTMIKDADKYTGLVLAYENDPRITKVGKFLRKIGLDEIPQFINVLKGDLSVVGPRPEPPEVIGKIKGDIPQFDMRLKIKPGITGFAQLNGKYDTPLDKKLKMDLLYVKQKCLILKDIYVMFNTVKLFFLSKKRK